MEAKKDPIVILGAGLVGSLWACYMAKRGHNVEIYERREDLRKGNISVGRSINLALSARGCAPLEEVGILEEIMKISIPMYGRMIHSVDGKQTFQPYSKDGKSAIFSVSRGDLNCKLMTLAEQNPKIKIKFDQRCTNVDLKTGLVSLQDELTKQAYTVQAETVFGCDGAFSAAREPMVKTPRFNYSQTYIDHGYKELHIPDLDGKWQLDKHCLHIWPRGTYMMIGLPNMDGSFTMTCFFPWEGQGVSWEVLDNCSDEKLIEVFKKDFPDALPLMPELTKDWKKNPTSGLCTVRTYPWSVNGKCALMGDAAHAVVPFFGQGMNCAFEDAAVMNQCITANEGNWTKIFNSYEKQRKVNADAIADMALENFIEMRDKVNDEHFQLKKKYQAALGQQFEGLFYTRYEMVSFKRIPYSEAKRIGGLTDEIAEELMKLSNNDVTKIDMVRAKQLIEEKLPKNMI